MRTGIPADQGTWFCREMACSAVSKHQIFFRKTAARSAELWDHWPDLAMNASIATIICRQPVGRRRKSPALFQWQIAEALHLLAVIADNAINLFRRQQLLPLGGAAFAEKALIGVRRTFAKAFFRFLGPKPRE